MSKPDLRHFLGWDKPAIELVAAQLEELNRTAPQQLRRATVVVPTSGSGRRLREYMAERADKPVLMPKIVLAGQLIPCKGNNLATEQETMAAWMEILGNAMPDKSTPWILEVSTQMRKVRKQLEQEARAPEWDENEGLNFVRNHLQEAENQWKHTLAYEKSRWDTLRTTHTRVDEKLQQWGRTPIEQSRAQELEYPQNRGMIIIACVPELSPLNRLYIKQLINTTQTKVKIWVNAPLTEADRFDEFGQPIPVITEGKFDKQGWSECPIEIPRRSHQNENDNSVCEADVIHPAGSVQAFGRKVKELAGGLNSEQVVIAGCDSSLSPVLVSTFLPEWTLIMPEGRSLQATEVGRIPMQLKNACATFCEEDVPRNYEMEDFLILLRNRALQCSLYPPATLNGFNLYVSELNAEHLPNSASHLLYLLKRKLSEENSTEQPNLRKTKKLGTYIEYTEKIIQLVHDCSQTDTMPKSLVSLASALQRSVTSPHLKPAVAMLAEHMRETADLVSDRLIQCAPFAALSILAHTVEKQSAAVLEGAAERDQAINLKGWRELCYTTAPHIIIAGMHDGCVPERLPADAYLPNAYRSFLNMTNDTTRCARDSFLLTALLHSRPVGAVHFVISACTTDGTPIAPSSLLMRCNTPAETAQRVSRLFAPSQEPEANETYDLLPFITPDTGTAPQESIDMIAPGVANPYREKQRTFSPSAIKSFLNCPLRFWLNRLLGVAPGDAMEENKSEPDNAEYGTLLHAILQDVTTRYAAAPDGSDAEVLAQEISTYAAKCTETQIRAQYGDENNAFPIIINILQRNITKTVQEFARKHAKDLCNGWEVIMMEQQLLFSLPSEDEDSPLLFDMRVDRVDRNRHSGLMRVIDYKSNATDPRQTHWERLSESATALYEAYMPKAFILRDEKDKCYRWSSVQLPLYAEALKQIHHLPTLPETAFYNMPRTSPGEVAYHPMTGLESKSEMTADLHEKAMQCVQAAASLMRKGLCLYSAESMGRSLSYDNFGALSIYKDPNPRVLCGLPQLTVPTAEEN